MEEKLNLILKVLALRLRLDHGFTNPLVEELVKEIDGEVGSPFDCLSDEKETSEQSKPKRGRPCKPK